MLAGKLPHSTIFVGCGGSVWLVDWLNGRLLRRRNWPQPVVNSSAMFAAKDHHMLKWNRSLLYVVSIWACEYVYKVEWKWRLSLQRQYYLMVHQFGRDMLIIHRISERLYFVIGYCVCIYIYLYMYKLIDNCHFLLINIPYSVVVSKINRILYEYPPTLAALVGGIRR